MNSLRHLHSIGVDHTHGLFDEVSFLNGTETESEPINITSEQILEDEDEALSDSITSDRNRTIYMSVLFSVLMAIYLGFCCLYHRKKARQRIGDSIHGDNSRDRRRNDNRAVLDESSDAANRARVNADVARKLEERKVRIQSVLVTRLVVEEDFGLEGTHSGEKTDNVAYDDELNGPPTEATKSCDNKEEDQLATPDVTFSTSEETCNDNHENITPAEETLSSSTKTPPTTPTRAPIAVTSSPSPCLDLKKYTEALQSSLANCSTNTNCSTHSCSNNNTDSLNTQNSNIELLNNKECNICLSAFQVGDRIAWAKSTLQKNESHDEESVLGENDKPTLNDAACRHIFHAECIERWLLVREECPVCRRNYFDDETTGSGTTNSAELEQDVQQPGVDVEMGEGGRGTLELVPESNVIVAVEE